MSHRPPSTGVGEMLFIALCVAAVLFWVWVIF